MVGAVRGASVRTLQRRVRYGGRKGRRAYARLYCMAETQLRREGFFRVVTGRMMAWTNGVWFSVARIFGGSP